MSDTAKASPLEIAQIIAELAPVAVDLALKLQTLFSNIDAQQPSTISTAEALNADQDTIDLVNKWAAEHNLSV